ncbi:hypothetical protein ABID19_001508 [Mesorhizobium robiniae]|uniref:Uncharacterized protein n=1 Tax=Mesorhizobium robiniae TaxID=559315 RepID=A0ABV2GJN2_9HYPH
MTPKTVSVSEKIMRNSNVRASLRIPDARRSKGPHCRCGLVPIVKVLRNSRFRKFIYQKGDIGFSDRSAANLLRPLTDHALRLGKPDEVA